MSRSNSDWLRERLGYTGRDGELIEAALTHRSAGGHNNERLEFLGDGVLNCVIADLLYREFPDADEGELSRLRATLVRQEALAQIAASLDLGAQLRLGPGELRSGGYRRESILADAFEALIGAIYLDGGFEAARRVIEELTLARIGELPAAAELKDPKTRLQEYLQARGLALPVYGLEEVVGESHNQTFTASCVVGALSMRASGQGASRRRAEQEAARLLLEALATADLAERTS
ncbi:MAG TPA: ribonuclease III [Steroidobacteraceae bacterium]|nr:ribonuclease III [Steroidobacteraceae bacterium]